MLNHQLAWLYRLNQRAIARKLKLARATVSKFAQAEEYPEMHHPKRGEKRSILNPYKRYILDRWQHGCTNGVQIYDEIKTRGFTGSAALLRMFLAELRKKHQEAGSAAALTLDPSQQTLEIPPSLPPKPCVKRRLSSTRASLFSVNHLVLMVAITFADGSSDDATIKGVSAAWWRRRCCWLATSAR